MESLFDLYNNQAVMQLEQTEAERAHALKAMSVVENDKRRMLEDPGKMDKAVANMAEFYSPSANLKHKKDEAFSTDSVERSKDGNDPTRGYGYSLRNEYANAMLDPKNQGVSAGELLHRTARDLLLRPMQDGSNLLTKTHEYTRAEQSQFFGGKATKALPGYEEWKADAQLNEKAALDREDWISGKELAADTALGAVFGAATGALGSGVAGALAGAGIGAGAGLAFGGPLGALAGTVLGGIGGALGGEATGAATGAAVGAATGFGGSLIAQPLKKLIHTTEAYRGKMMSPSKWDKGKLIAADLAAYLPGAIAAGVGIGKAADKMGSALRSGLEAEGGASFAVDGMTGKPLNKFEQWKKDFATANKTGSENLLDYTPSAKEPGRVFTEDGFEILQPANEFTAETASRQAKYEKDRLREIPKDKTIYSNADYAEEVGAEMHKLTGGNGYEWPGVNNLNRAEDVSPFGVDDMLPTTELKAPKQQRLLGYDQPGFDEFQRAAEGKLYSDFTIPEKDVRLSENELFSEWQKMADKGQRPFNPYEEVKGENDLATALRNKFTAKQKIQEDPSAKNLVKVSKEQGNTASSELVSMHENLSPDGLQEANLEPIPEGNPRGIKQLKGSISGTIRKATDNDAAAALGKQDITGETRQAIERNSTNEFRNKPQDATINDPLVQAVSSIEENPVVTAENQAKAGKEITTNAAGGDAVTEEVFPGSTNKEESNAKRYAVIAGLAALGMSAPTMYDMFSNDAHAGMLSAFTSAARAAGKEAINVTAEAALKAGYISKPITTETVMGVHNWQRGLDIGKDLVNTFKENLRNNRGEGTQYSLMSPFQIFDALTKTAQGKFTSPATLAASFQTAGSQTRKNALKVVGNILNEGGIKSSANQVRKAVKDAGLLELGARAAKEDALYVQMEKAGNRIKIYQKKLGKEGLSAEDAAKFQGNIQVETDNIMSLRDKYNEVYGSVDKYHKSWEDVMQGLAKEHSGVRVSLALEDPTRSLYPWLPELSRGEEIAVGKLRGLLDQYRVRLKERGIATRNNYVEHAPHPDMKDIFQNEFSDVFGGAPFQRFYSRSDSSRMLLPDISYTMNHYITDIEPRIQNHDLWKETGLKQLMYSPIVRSNPGLRKAFRLLYEGTKPTPDTWGNRAANAYSQFEAVRLLFMSPGSGLKHAVKVFADLASVGPEVWMKSLPDAFGYMTRSAMNKTYGVNNTSMRDLLSKVGVNSKRFERQLVDDLMDSSILSGHTRRYMLDAGIDSQDAVFNKAKELWGNVQDTGSMFINLAELMDRASSVSSAIQMANKKGMTVDQAMYGTYDLILKNNFLSGQFNPAWLNNPKIRAFMMFQATPFKIFERRLVNAQKSYENVSQLSKGIQQAIKDPAIGWDGVLQQVKQMKDYVRGGQSELKSNLVIDTLRNETDFFGTPVVNQMLTDMLTVGAATYLGGQAGLALSDHFFHIPFLTQHDESGNATLAVSPVVSSTMKAYNEWKKGDGEDFLLGTVLNKWLGPYGPLPKTLEKAVRLSNNDIPEMYQKGGDAAYLKYLFSVPGKGD